MMTLQQTLGILLLVYSVAVALPHERKRGRVNHYEENFGLSSDEDVPDDSGENVPVKFGRTIHHSAWSTEDTESSDENNQESAGTSDTKEKPWSFSNALSLALNFVNKLKGGSFDYPVVKANENKKAPKSEITNESEDRYWPLFKKWLRRNKILKNDDTLSSYLLEHNSRFNDNKNYPKKPRKKHFKKPKSSADQNKRFGDENNEKKNWKSDINNKNKLSPIPKTNNYGNSPDEDQSSKELSTPYKTKEHHSHDDEICDSSKLLFKNKNTKSNDLIKTNKQNKTVETETTVFTHLNRTSAEVTTAFSSESIRKSNKPLDILRKHQNNKSIENIYPETQTDSLGLLINPKQRDPILFPITKNKIDPKMISKKFEALSNKPTKKKAPIKIQNDQAVKSAPPYKVQNASQKPLMPFESQRIGNPKNNSKNSQKTKKVAHTGSTIPPTADKSLKEKASNNFLATENGPQATKSPPEEKVTVSSVSSSKPTGILKLNSTDPQTLGRVTSNDLPAVKSVADSTNGSKSEKMPVNESSSKPQNVETPKRNSNSLITNKVLKLAVLQKGNNGTQAIEHSKDFQPKKVHVTVSTTKPQFTMTVKKGLRVDPAISSSPHTPGKIITKETLSDLPVGKSIPHTEKSPKSTPYETVPISDPLSKPQSFEILSKNPKKSQMTEKDLEPALLENKTSPRAADEVIVNDLPVNKNGSQAKISSKNSPLQLPVKSMAKETSNTSPIPDSIIKKPFSVSKHKSSTESTPEEIEKNPRIDEQPSATVFVSPQSNEKRILKENFKPMEISPRLDETPFRKAVYQKGIPTENTSEEDESEPNDLFTKYDDSGIISDEDYPTNRLSFFSTRPRNEAFGAKDPRFEDLDMDSYSGMDSDESDEESDENMNSASLPHRGNVERPTVLGMDDSSSKEPKEKHQFPNEESRASLSVEDLKPDKEVEDRTGEKGEERGKFDTFLQYIYQNSNSSFFQSLRQNADNF